MYPYLRTGVVESEGVSLYLFGVLAVAFGLLGWWVYSLFQLGTGGSPSLGFVAQTSTARAAAAVSTADSYMRPTLVHVAAVPVVGAVTAVPVASPTAVPVASPTAVREVREVREVPSSRVERVTAVATLVPVSIPFIADVGYYWPDWGPDWCLVWGDGECVSTTTDGRSWRDWVGVVAACPDVMLGGRVEVPGVGSWDCADTGISASCWADYCSILVLSEVPVVARGSALFYPRSGPD